jgi:hypothetical protein
MEEETMRACFAMRCVVAVGLFSFALVAGPARAEDVTLEVWSHEAD